MTRRCPAFVRSRRAASAIALAVAVLVAGCEAPDRPPPPPPAVQLPALRVAELGGRLASIDRFRGRVMVLNVWATWCAPCRREMPSLDRLHLRLDPSRFVVTGVAVDEDPVAVREFLLQRGLTFPNFVAVPRREFLDALGIRSVPATLVVAPDGTVLQRISGPREWDGPEAVAMIESAWTAARPASGPPRARRDAAAKVPGPAGGQDGRS